MDTSALLTRYSWPGLSFLMGLVLGGISNTGPAPAAKEKAPATMPALEGRHKPRGVSASSAPPTATHAALRVSWPDHVARQMVDPNYLEHARTIWVPSELAEILRWKLGYFDKGIKLGAEAKALLELNEVEALQVRNAIDDFVREIRDIEQKKFDLAGEDAALSYRESSSRVDSERTFPGA